MYPTDQMYEAIFNFKDKDSPVEHFEFLGYEGVIFISLTGSIIINLLTPLILWTFQRFMACLARKFMNVKLFKTIGVYYGHTNLLKTVRAIYMASLIELVFSALVSVLG